jgi:aminopeptidase C
LREGVGNKVYKSNRIATEVLVPVKTADCTVTESQSPERNGPEYSSVISEDEMAEQQHIPRCALWNARCSLREGFLLSRKLGNHYIP